MFNTQITTSAKVTTSRKAISYQRKRICVMQVWVPGLSRPRQSAAAASSSLIFKAEINSGTRIWTIVSDGLVTMFLKLNSIPRIFMAVLMALHSSLIVGKQRKITDVVTIAF